MVGPAIRSTATTAPESAGPRPHVMLAAVRPAAVTILTLVRDAVSRLPNGEGTRADIVELLRDRFKHNLNLPAKFISVSLQPVPGAGY